LSGRFAGMSATAEIGALYTSQAVHEAREILRANGMEMSVYEKALGPGPMLGSLDLWVPLFLLRVPKEDEQRAREALRGAFASEWFLRAPDHRPYHSFEAATVEALRHYFTSHQGHEVDFELREADHLADLMEQHGWHTVWHAFHEGHIIHHPRLVDGKSLDEWARLCGCAHYHTRPNHS
jgi:hypothetical protein